MSLVFKPRILMVNLSGASRERVKPMTISLHHTTYKLNFKKKGSNSEWESGSGKKGKSC